MFHRIVVLILFALSACRAPTPAAPTTSLEEETGGPDQVDLIDGQKVYGRVVSENDSLVVLGQRNGTFTINKTEVREIRRGAAPPAQKTQLAKSERLPAFAEMLEVVARQSWAADLRQVPATVIDVGELRNIPYVSHKAGKVEFNVYGDPDHPAGVEIGIYDLSPDQATRETLRSFMVDVLSNADDKIVVTTLGLEHDSRQYEGLTFDVDPPTAADSYGGWWITVYDARALDRARASAEEMKSLVTPISRTTPEPPTSTSSSWSSSDYGQSSKSSTSGTVYVRGYSRKNGTYVQPHTRSAPRRRR